MLPGRRGFGGTALAPPTGLARPCGRQFVCASGCLAVGAVKSAVVAAPFQALDVALDVNFESLGAEVLAHAVDVVGDGAEVTGGLGIGAEP